MNKKEPYIAHSGLTGEIYVIVGNDKYNVTDQAKRAVKAVEQEPCDKVRTEIEAQEKWLAEAGYNAYNVGVAFGAIKHMLQK